MVVGVLKVSLLLPENHSLKGKRGVLKSIQARLSNRFNVSVTECGDQELWQSAILGFGAVGSSQQIVDAILRQVVECIDDMGLAEVRNTEIEVFHC
jgi:uncharacterized protein YlxP (DUF503 family)